MVKEDDVREIFFKDACLYSMALITRSMNDINGFRIFTILSKDEWEMFSKMVKQIYTNIKQDENMLLFTENKHNNFIINKKKYKDSLQGVCGWNILFILGENIDKDDVGAYHNTVLSYYTKKKEKHI